MKLKSRQAGIVIFLFLSVFGLGVYFKYFIQKQPVNSGPPTDIAKMKIYENQNFGFKAAYPSDWAIELEVESVNFTNTKDPSQEITVSVSDAKYYDSVKKSFSGQISVPFNIDGFPGLKFSSNDEKLITVIVVKGQRLFYISSNVEYFKTFISTFNFV